jgi:hypothetical protein
VIPPIPHENPPKVPDALTCLAKPRQKAHPRLGKEATWRRRRQVRRLATAALLSR